MGRVFLTAIGVGLWGLVVGVPLVQATNLFRDLSEGSRSVVIVMFFLAGMVTGAIAGATDAVVRAIRQK